MTPFFDQSGKCPKTKNTNKCLGGMQECLADMQEQVSRQDSKYCLFFVYSNNLCGEQCVVMPPRYRYKITPLEFGRYYFSLNYLLTKFAQKTMPKNNSAKKTRKNNRAKINRAITIRANQKVREKYTREKNNRAKNKLAKTIRAKN